MLSDRVQRQVDRLLDQAEEAIALRQWEDLRATCEVVLNLDPDNADAARYLVLADKSLATDVVSDSSDVAEPAEDQTLEYGNAFEYAEGDSNVREEFRFIFKQLFGTSGRVNRSSYFFRALLFWFLIGIGIPILLEMNEVVLGITGFLFSMVGLVLGFCTSVRRFHDFNWWGASVLLLLIPLVGMVFAFMLLFRSGTRGTNNHGNEPVDLAVGF
jgi:uncharacterized membrane protein YhaH (DUF805 family)